ncbi:glycoside hydrolase family 108 protein [Mucilaginibacter phyllosphaerae]|uniref:Lysozyme family protein n=1 Tax=Mucilaginibacter phyllosphaerae TaxID=1812349 RepID=A0A4Y8AB10_9SPHI|nr:glycosyl hydrolase 108 family protein [Mucilaginibacter phyllosphaerae]MBB3969712.1 lysozyme family protein [Mucilaginibacter phyllosphaerae]TEW65095.1 hypothetical protein E2R65_14360 [Mucilaginibacter phyllosphaerae]GGH18014.1 hypothetical protein GCM10007352_28450 [Mucilaginibacter phyllosphaerae]
MTAQFEATYAITMKNEGGYANNPNDRGGETWRGIARNFWGSWPGWKIVDQIKQTNPASLNAALAANTQLESLVLVFYKQNFWNPLRLDQIVCAQIANQLFDISVNSGTARGAKMLQQAINQFRGNNPIAVDGQVGPATLAAANSIGHQQLYNQINVLRAAFYNSIIQNNPSQAQFRNSWFSRIKPFVPESGATQA